MKVGIDTLAIDTARYALDLKTLAQVRGVDPNKYTKSLGQLRMSVPPPGEDIVTMGAKAAKLALRDINTSQIEMLLFATESGIDFSKAAGIYIHDLLNLPSRCRVVELKQACYSATAGLQLALPFLRENPDKKILLVASDIARYGINSPAESSQGCGAVAMVLSANPRIIAFDKEYGVVTENVMDFWRPNYLHHALVDGKYSSKLYLTLLEKSWFQYQQLSGRSLDEHTQFCYHTPVPRLVEKAHHYLLKINGKDSSDEVLTEQLKYHLAHSREMGNSYSAALYIGLASLLDHDPNDLSNQRIGFYSYGSGCVAEYFSGVIQPEYRSVLQTKAHQALFAQRHLLTYEEYERFYNFCAPEDGREEELPLFDTGAFRLERFQRHKRIYTATASAPLACIDNQQAKELVAAG